MSRAQLALVAALFICAAALAAPAANTGRNTGSTGPGQYNPFTLKRDAPSAPTKLDTASDTERDKVKKLKHKPKPPKKPKPRSPHKPHDDDDDDHGHHDNDDDHGHGHGDHDDDHGHGDGGGKH
jgi:hypothetical protein